MKMLVVCVLVSIPFGYTNMNAKPTKMAYCCVLHGKTELSSFRFI